ncbi:10215_t:CDS:2, partial [Entrophospora sp. SA101]
DVLREIIRRATTKVRKFNDQNSEKYRRLIEIPSKFDDAYEGVFSLRKISKESEVPLTENEIQINLRELKTNLSKIICADSEMVTTLQSDAYDFFMDPAERMKVSAPSLIKDKCDEFVINFRDSADIPINRLSHDKNWKESYEDLSKIATDILEVLGDVWKNPAFRPNLAKSQSEGTYMTHVIIPMIRASLKGLPVGKSGYISTAESQSVASKDRRGVGKRPDAMFITTNNNRLYEIVFAESS